jgi:hypothetical protein
VRHFRGDTELQPITQENNYDFNFQDFQRTSGECVIMPNDQITVECTYNTLSRDKPLFVSLINYMLYKYENTVKPVYNSLGYSEFPVITVRYKRV